MSYAMESNHNQIRMVQVALTLLTEQLVREGKTGIYRMIAAEVDRTVLSTVLRHVRGKQTKASAMLGLSRTTLRTKLRAATTVSAEVSFRP